MRAYNRFQKEVGGLPCRLRTLSSQGRTPNHSDPGFDQSLAHQPAPPQISLLLGSGMGGLETEVVRTTFSGTMTHVKR